MATEAAATTGRAREGWAERIVRRRHAVSLHQAIAFDALAALRGPDAARWRRLLLGEAALFARGADAPDTEFRDFRNHVVFPRDGYWGGAIPRAQSWYQNLVAALAKAEWRNAAYCAGVLSHYVTDALHPFHTAQSEAENDVHLACDTATRVLYPVLRVIAETRPRQAPKLSEGPNFLAVALVAGAEVANQAYEGLLAHLSLARAASAPAAGLDAMGRRLMAEVIARQTGLLAAIYDRACRDARALPPETSLAQSAFVAVLKMPLGHIARTRQQRDAHRCIALMHDELQAKGQVTVALPEEERIKRDLYAKEIVARRSPASVDNVFPLERRRQTAARIEPATIQSATTDDGAEIIVLHRQRAVMEMPRPAPPRTAADPVRSRAGLSRAAAANAAREETMPPSSIQPSAAAPVSLSDAAAGGQSAIGHAAAAMLLPALAQGVSNFRDRRQDRDQRSLPDDVIAGLRPVEMRLLRSSGILSADALLSADADDLITRLGADTIGADIVRGWQARVRLVRTVPKLAASDAELLVASGYPTAAQIAGADADLLCADVLRFAATAAGQRLLTSTPPPDLAHVRALIEAARAARAA